MANIILGAFNLFMTQFDTPFTPLNWVVGVVCIIIGTLELLDEN